MIIEQLGKIGVEIIHVGNKVVRGCLACNGCVKNQNEKCVINDEVNDWIPKMKEADLLMKIIIVPDSLVFLCSR